MLQNEHPVPSETASFGDVVTPILRRPVMSPADFDWTTDSYEMSEDEWSDE